jgi:hypothetical protein
VLLDGYGDDGRRRFEGACGQEEYSRHHDVQARSGLRHDAMRRFVYRSGPNYPLPHEVQAAPLELYRSHVQQEEPDVLAEGLRRFLPGQVERWLPQRMIQQQWKKDSDGYFRPFDSSGRTYVAAAVDAQGYPLPPPYRENSSTAMLPTLYPRDARYPSGGRQDAFQRFAVDMMQQGAWRFDRKPHEGNEWDGEPALSRNIPPPQLLPGDMEALASYEESAFTAAQLRRSQATRRAIDEIRRSDRDVYAMSRRGRR